MAQVFLPFHIAVYPSEANDIGSFTAHCLNMDLLADDDTVEGAVSRLLESIEAALEIGAAQKANVFRDAPRAYWDKLAKAQKLSRELIDRIIHNADQRRHRAKSIIDIETQCDLRQLQTA